MATTLLKSTELKRFFVKYGTVAGGYEDIFEPRLDTKNVVASLWEEWIVVAQCSCGSPTAKDWSPCTRPPLTSYSEHEEAKGLDWGRRSRRRVSEEHLAGMGTCLLRHQMWYVHKYRGIGGLSQEAIEDAHKEVNRDVNVFSAAGTRVAGDANWLRIIGGYNLDLLTLWEDDRLRNGVHIDKYKCTCRAGQQKRCAMCIQRDDPVKLLQLGF